MELREALKEMRGFYKKNGVVMDYSYCNDNTYSIAIVTDEFAGIIRARYDRGGVSELVAVMNYALNNNLVEVREYSKLEKELRELILAQGIDLGIDFNGEIWYCEESINHIDDFEGIMKLNQPYDYLVFTDMIIKVDYENECELTVNYFEEYGSEV